MMQVFFCWLKGMINSEPPSALMQVSSYIHVAIESARERARAAGGFAEDANAIRFTGDPVHTRPRVTAAPAPADPLHAIGTVPTLSVHPDGADKTVRLQRDGVRTSPADPPHPRPRETSGGVGKHSTRTKHAGAGIWPAKARHSG